MPWTVKDVDRHKKGLSPSQKRKWVSIANAVLRTCKAQGGGKSCEGKAIRIANSKFNDKEIKMAREIPQGATILLDEGQGCQAFAEFKEGEKTKIKMVAYSGKIIKNHWYWGDLAIDLEGMKFPKSKYPILEEHMSNRKIGFTPKPIVDEKGQLVLPEDAELVETEYADEFVRLSKQGFPYQSSISARPTRVERLEEGAKSKVNGFTMVGPASIWRESIFKEASVCLFGADDKTKSQAFGDPIEMEFSESVIPAEGSDHKPRKIIKNTEGGEKSMNLEELKKEHPDLVNEIVDETTQSLTAKFDKEKENLQAQISQKDKDVESLSEKVLDLEKREAIRSEAELKTEANEIWKDKLSKSQIPERLYTKVMPHVNHEKFVENGVLNQESFIEAIDAEIKDWESKVPADTVQGSSFSKKSVDSTEEGASQEDAQKFKEENESIANRLLGHVGQKPQKKEE